MVARGRLLDVDPPPETRPHLDGAGPGVEVGRPRGVAALALRGGGGGVATEGTTAVTVTAVAGAVVVVPPSPSLRLVRLIIVVGHRRWWRSTPTGGAAHRRGGTAHQRGGATEEEWVGGGRPLGSGSSGSEKKNLSYDYHVGEMCAAEY
jgi:hypothetical protein